jgi:hypothetical protein
MGLSSGLRMVADLIEESQEFGEVRNIRALDSFSDAENDEVEFEMDLAVPLCSTTYTRFRPISSRVDSDGSITLAFELEGNIFADQRPTDIVVDTQNTTVEQNGIVVMTIHIVVLAEAVGSERQSRTESTSRESGERSIDPVVVDVNDDRKSENQAASGSVTRREKPPFRDVELLEEIYESCDTFAEMQTEIEMDVSAETVRRYMIEHGIHQPTSYNSKNERSESEDAPRPRDAEDLGSREEDCVPDVEVSTEGMDLPDTITAEELIESVRRSSTVFEFQRDVGLEHDEALTLLTEFGLCDFVTGRLSALPEGDVQREDVVERLQESMGKC